MRRIGTAVRIFSLAAIGVTCVGLAWLGADPDRFARYARSAVGVNVGQLSVLSPGYWLALALAALPAGPFIQAMWLLARLFRRFEQGHVLEQANAATMSRIGWLFVAAGIATPLSRMLQSVALTYDGTQGGRQLAVGLDAGSFGMIAAGVALFGFGLVLREAVRLARENDSFV
jgi:hypothetical protein